MSTQHRLAALMSHAKYPAGERTKQLRSGFEAQFIRQARELHPDAPDTEVQRVAGILRRAYFVRLSALGADARARKAGR